MTSAAYTRFTAFRKSQPRSPRLERELVQVRGLTIAVFRTPPVADAPPLCCVNGGMIFSHSLLWPALAPLAQRRQLILFDLRGRGESQTPPAPHASRVEFDAGDVVTLRSALGLDQWDLLGHSWGGGIAMLAAANDPSGVRRLVLASAVGPTSDWVASLHQRALDNLENPERATLAALDPAALHQDDPEIHATYSRALYPAYFADRELSRMFAAPRALSATGAAVAARLRREGYDWRSSLHAIRAETLLVHGRNDVLPATLVTESAALIPGARELLIDDAGHMPFWEQPTRFFGAVDSFLTDGARSA